MTTGHESSDGNTHATNVGESKVDPLEVRSYIDPKERNNDLAPESDCRAILQVLSKRAREASQLEEKDGGLQKQVMRSMLQHFPRFVVPVTDESFHRYCFQLEQDFCTKQKNSNNNNNEHEKESTALEPQVSYEMSDFDEEELLDVKSLEQVRELRQKVRAQAQKVAQMREQVLNEAREMTQKELESFRQSWQKASHNSQDDKEIEFQAQQMQQYEQDVQHLQQTLQQTKEQLETVTQTQLPAAVEKWNTQMETLEEGDRWELSQTEQAIRSRGLNTISVVPSTLPAEDRVMRYLS